MRTGYVGRFAPSPTGPLHFGSLVTGLASFLSARHAGGTWLLRIEDLDPPRESLSAPSEIITQLRSFQLYFDGEVTYQSKRQAIYRSAFTQLLDLGLIYPCICSRKGTPRIYPGTCRTRSIDPGQNCALRLKIGAGVIEFNDDLFGHQTWDLDREVGDFVIQRRDGLIAYQFAVVVDDHAAGITHVVRGSDLLDSTAKQLIVYRSLGAAPPTYLHVPIIVDANGEKLSKQAHSPPIGTSDTLTTLRAALAQLRQSQHMECTTMTELLQRAIKSWQPQAIPKLMQLSI